MSTTAYATPEQEALLKRAAEIRHKSLTDFVLDSACLAAEQTLLDQRLFRISEGEYADPETQLHRHVLYHVQPGDVVSFQLPNSAEAVVVFHAIHRVRGVANPIVPIYREREVGFILGQAGLLDGRTATTHWLLAAEFRRAFTRVRLDIDRLYVDDGRVHTSAGRMAAMDMALHLLALDRGQVAANDMSRVLVSAPQRSGGQAQFVKDSLLVGRTTSIGRCWGPRCGSVSSSGRSRGSSSSRARACSSPSGR